MNISRVQTFAFSGDKVSHGEVQAQIADGSSTIVILGLAEHLKRETHNHVRAIFNGLSLALPARRLTVDLLIDGDHQDGRRFDLAIVLAILGAMDLLPRDELVNCAAYGGLSAVASIRSFDSWPTVPVKPSLLKLRLICPKASEQQALEAGFQAVLATDDLFAIINHFKGSQRLSLDRVPVCRDPDRSAETFAPTRNQGIRSWLPSWFYGGRRDLVMPERSSAPLARGFSEGVGVRPAAGAKKTTPMDFHAERAAPGPPPFASTGPHGHRARMREKVLTRGTDALADYELLEMLLFLAFKQGDTKRIAKAVINRFGSFAKVLSASERELLDTPGLGPHAVSAIKVVQASAVRLALAEVMDQPILNSWDRLMNYLNMVMAREPIEQFRILFLDNRNHLLADEVQARGTVNHTPVYPREVVKRALELHATALILVHNHPSGDPTPSNDDVEMTQDIRRAASALSIVVHDHVIVGNGRWYSFRREKLL